MEEQFWKIIKTDNLLNVALYCVLTPDYIDRNWDKISQEEITKTAYEFIQNLEKKAVNINHEENTDLETAKFVESYITPVDIEVWENIIKKWSWIVWIQFDKSTYEDILKWEYVGVSMDWFWYKKEI